MRSILFGTCAALVLVTGVARADLAPPDSEQCSGKATNAACTTDEGAPGTCVESTCSHTSPGPDGGVPSTYACALCEEADGGPTPPCSTHVAHAACTLNGAAGTCEQNMSGLGFDCIPSTGDAGQTTGDSGVTTIAIDAGTTTTTPPAKSSSSGGCSIGAMGAGDIASGLGILGLFVPFAMRRRRNRK